jgi:RNA polymerase sigma-70 factor (ECF subfamily)
MIPRRAKISLTAVTFSTNLRVESQNSFGPQQIRQDNRAEKSGHEAKIRGTGEDRRERGVTGVATNSSLVPTENDEHVIDLADCEASLRRYFTKRVRARWDVEDLVQESLARFIVASRSSLSQPFGYLFRIANNLLVDRARRASTAPTLVVMLSEHDHPVVRPEQEDLLHLADLRTKLELALDELPAKCREAFILRRFHAMDTPAIASRLNVSHRMVQKYLIRTMEHLHLRLRLREDPHVEVSQKPAGVADAHPPFS